MATREARRPAMVFIMVAVFLDMLGIGLIVPVLPAMVGSFTASPSEQTFWFGAVVLSFGVANFISAPVLGALSDRHGRRPVLLLGFFGMAVSFLVTGLASALWMLVVVRLFSGAMQANAAVANAYVADITAAPDRARRFGLLGAMFGLGFTLGPAIGGVLGSVDLRWPFLAAGLLALLNVAYGLVVLPESLPIEQRRPMAWRRAHPLAALTGLARLSGAGPLVGILVLAGLTQFTTQNSFVLYTTFKFGWGPRDNGLALFTVGFMSVLVQGVLLKHFLRWFSARTLVVGGLLASVCTYAAFGAISEGWMMFVVIVVGSLFGAGAMAVVQGTISGLVDSTSQGRIMGAVAALNSLMAVIAPVLSTGLLGFVSELPRGDWRIGLPFYFCSALQLAAAVLAARHFGRAGASREGTRIAAQASSEP